MTRIQQQWHAFVKYADPILAEGREPPPARERPQVEIVAASTLSRHRAGAGLACPKCGGQIVKSHPRDMEPVCLQCGYEPISRQPSAYSFEPYRDEAKESRLAFVRTSHLDSAVVVRVVAEPLAADACVKCDRIVPASEPFRVHRCQECYREYLAQFRLRAF